MFLLILSCYYVFRMITSSLIDFFFFYDLLLSAFSGGPPLSKSPPLFRVTVVVGAVAGEFECQLVACGVMGAVLVALAGAVVVALASA
jgi:hypothetical protein